MASGTTLCYQAFIKQPGTLTWAPGPVNAQGVMTPSAVIYGTAAIWCDTGTGTNAAGHLLVLVNTSGTQTASIILDAGKVQLGQGAVTEVTTNPAFIGRGVAATAGSNLDLDADGVGSTTGFAISAYDANNAFIASWGVSATGHLTTGYIISGEVACGTLSATTKLHIGFVAPGLFAAIFPSAVNAGQLTIIGVATSGILSAPVDSGTSGNFPTPSATLAWDFAASAPTMSQIWLYAWSSVTATTMLRIPVTFGAGGVGLVSPPTVGATVTDDSALGTGTPTTIRVVNNPVDLGHVDWQATGTVGGNPALLGDFSAFPVAPSLPQLVSPANNAAIALAAGGVIDWNFLSLLFGDAQVSYAFERRLSGGALQWWNATTVAWVGAEVYNTSALTQVTFPAGQWTASGVYSWTVSVIGASGLASGYASPWTLTVLVAPANPTLTATYDAATNRNVLVAQGTASTATVGSIEYSDDGSTTWAFIRGATAFTIYPGPVTFYDREFGAAATRQYRARAWTVLPFNPSGYATASVAPPTLASYHLIDFIGGSQRNEALTIHGPIGAAFDLIVADLIRGRIKLKTFTTQNEADRDTLDAIIDLQRPLWFQSPTGRSSFVRVTAATTTEVPVAGAPFITYFEHSVTFSTVARPAP